MNPKKPALISLAALALTACGSSTGEPGGSSEASVSATIETFQFEPNPLEIEAGTTVTWTNNDDIDHTVTSGTQAGDTVPGVSEGASAEPDGLFRGVLSSEGKKFEFTFDDAGEYAYFCEIHSGMTATVIVR